MSPSLKELAAEAQLEGVRNGTLPSEIDLQTLQDFVTTRESWPTLCEPIIGYSGDFGKWNVSLNLDQNNQNLVLLFPCSSELLLYAAGFGWKGVVSDVGQSDVFELQYLIEMARDLKMGFFPLAHKIADVKMVLQTDCPTIVLGDFFAEHPSAGFGIIKQFARLLPSNVSSYAASFAPYAPEEVQKLKGYGVRGSFYLQT